VRFRQVMIRRTLNVVVKPLRGCASVFPCQRGPRPRFRGVSGRSEGGPAWCVAGPADSVSVERRRYTKVVRGEQSAAGVALAHLRLTVERSETVIATNARPLEAACRLYLSEARTNRSTLRTDRSACNRICSTMLPGGQRAGDLASAKLDWKRVEEIFAKWEGGLSPQARSRYASTLAKLIDYAMRSGWLRANVVKQARRPRVPNHKPEVPVNADVRAVLQAVEAVDFNFSAYVLVDPSAMGEEFFEDHRGCRTDGTAQPCRSGKHHHHRPGRAVSSHDEPSVSRMPQARAARRCRSWPAQRAPSGGHAGSSRNGSRVVRRGRRWRGRRWPSRNPTTGSPAETARPRRPSTAAEHHHRLGSETVVP
jgi:hypothetical protein